MLRLNLCKELLLHKKGNPTAYPVLHNIKQYSSISLLGVAIRSNCTCKFSLHVKAKFNEANKMFIYNRSLCKEGYTQGETDFLFNAIVLPKIMYGLSVYTASISGLISVQSFSTRCHKRYYTSVSYNVNKLLEKRDHCLFFYWNIATIH